MPQISLKKSKTVNKKAAPNKQDDSTLPQAKGSNPWPSPWGDDFGDLMNDFSRPTASKSRMSPQERIVMIEKVFEEVLGRKPDTRDLNYYKYSTLSEEEILRQLLAGKEHQKLLEDGREYKKLNERATQAETRIKMLEAQNKDQIEEFKQLGTMLKEKNTYIQQLREQLKNPYNMTETVPSINPNIESTPAQPTHHTMTFVSPSTSDNKASKKESLLERILDAIRE